METAHIYIYGDIGYWQSKDASDWGEVTLTDIREQYEAQKGAEDITVHIHSPGGYITEGFAIHDYIRSLGKPVTTIIEGMCYSIATVIALAGDVRKMTSNADFMVHLASGGAFGNSDEIQEYAESLKEAEAKIAKFYSQKTGLTEDEALDLMKDETFMSAETALSKGFITEIMPVMKAVAKFNFNNSNKQKPMSKKKMTKKEAESSLDKALNSIKNIFKGSNAQNKIVQDSDGTEIDFTELEEDEKPSVGDTATVDDALADGEYTMPNGEIYVFEAGELTEIKPKEDEGGEEGEEGTSEEVENLEKEVNQLKKELKAEKKAAKTLRTENKALQKSAKVQAKAIETVKEEILNVKKSIGSGFNHEEGNRNTGKGKSKNRSVWKTED